MNLHRALAGIRRPFDLWESWSFLARFTSWGLILTVLTGVGLGRMLSWQVEQTTLEAEAQRVAMEIPLKLEPELQRSDFSGPLPADRYALMDRLVRDRILDQQIVRVKVWAPDGTIVYSDDRSIVGQRFAVEDELEEALDGEVAREISDLSKPENDSERGRFSRLMEIYVPIRLGGGRVVGVYEAYRDLGSLDAQIGGLQRSLWISLALAFAGFYLAMFGLISRASRDLRRRNEELHAEVLRRQRSEEQMQESEARLRHAQKMEAVGQLAGGVAHDFNNLLTAIIGFATLVRDSTRLTAREETYLDEIVRAGERAGGLTRQLLAFGRRQVLHPEVLDMNGSVADVQRLLERVIGEHIHLVARPAACAAWVNADPGQVEQVVVNLAVNARDAMPDGGTLSIEVSFATLDAAYTASHPDVPAGEYVELAVSDSGTGMDPAVQARIFEPFFTTKEPGKGTGLGLATVYGIVKQSGGGISVYSELGRGTTFRVYVPRVAAPEGAVDAGEGGPRMLPRGVETVLLVEDQDSLRLLAHETLTAQGYTVLDAASGEDAMARCLSCDGPIHLLLTDVVMPGMGGRQLADWMTGVKPDVKVLYMSGYSDEMAARQGPLDPGSAYLSKPFVPDALVRKVRETLDNQAARVPAATVSFSPTDAP